MPKAKAKKSVRKSKASRYKNYVEKKSNLKMVKDNSFKNKLLRALPFLLLGIALLIIISVRLSFEFTGNVPAVDAITQTQLDDCRNQFPDWEGGRSVGYKECLDEYTIKLTSQKTYQDGYFPCGSSPLSTDNDYKDYARCVSDYVHINTNVRINGKEPCITDYSPTASDMATVKLYVQCINKIKNENPSMFPTPGTSYILDALSSSAPWLQQTLEVILGAFEKDQDLLTKLSFVILAFLFIWYFSGELGEGDLKIGKKFALHFFLSFVLSILFTRWVVSPSVVSMILQPYNAAGIALGSIVPLMLITYITTKMLGDDAWIIPRTILWILFMGFLVFMSWKTWRSDGGWYQWIYVGTAAASAILFWKNKDFAYAIKKATILTQARKALSPEANKAYNNFLIAQENYAKVPNEANEKEMGDAKKVYIAVKDLMETGKTQK